MVLPDSDRVSRAPPYLGKILRKPCKFRLQGYHLLWPGFPACSTTYTVCNFLRKDAASLQNLPTTPPKERLHALPLDGLGCSLFARHYLGNRFCFLLLGVLRCFSSPGSPPKAYVFSLRVPELNAQEGFPIRKSPDQRLLATSRSLSQLATSFIAILHQGIHRMPLVAWYFF